MTEKIKPALTAEEWERARRSQAYNANVSFTRWLVSHTAPELRVPYVQTAEYSQQQIAALALYGQPFGFTREDVNILNNAALFLAERLEVAELYSNLAARIEALLPPKTR